MQMQAAKKRLIAEGLIVFGCMAILTLFGLSQTFVFKNPQLDRVLLWFPAALAVKHFTGGDIAMLMTACVQFLLLGAVYVALVRYLRRPYVALICVAVYFLLLLIGWSVVR